MKINTVQTVVSEWPKRTLHSVSEWFKRTAGGEQRPVMFDIDTTYPTLRGLEASYSDIRAEVDEVLADRDAIPAYHDLDPDAAVISNTTPQQWKVFYLWAMGEAAEPNAAKCPKTMAALEKIPNLFQAFFSILDPGKSIPEHCGPYCGYLRYHLGLIVPENQPPQIRVREQLYTWQECQSVLFDDSWNHEVINSSDGERIVLVADVLRPMPFPQSMVNRCLTLAFRYLYGKIVLRRAAVASATDTPR